MRSLFDADEFSTEEAEKVKLEIEYALEPIIKKYAELNYSMREIESIILHVAALETSRQLCIRFRKIKGDKV